MPASRFRARRADRALDIVIVIVIVIAIAIAIAIAGGKVLYKAE